MSASPSVFAPEVKEYMLLNGFKEIVCDNEIGCLTFRRGDVAVQFWQDKIERRIISPDKTTVTRHLKSFKGFDGKNVLNLMLILHLLDAVNLREVKREVYKELGIDETNHIAETIMQMAL